MLLTAFILIFNWSWVWCNGDALGFTWELREFLIEFFGDERHHGVEYSQSVFKADEQGESSHFFFLLTSRDKDRFGGLKVHITEIIKPKVVEIIGGFSQSKLFKTLIDFLDHFVHFS